MKVESEARLRPKLAVRSSWSMRSTIRRKRPYTNGRERHLPPGRGIYGDGGVSVTVAQDESSRVVCGMPKVAAELRAAQHIATLDTAAPTVIQALARKEMHARAAST